MAVAAVVLFHAGHLRGGYLGVDLFFVLSGFLITSLLLREHATAGRIGLAGFWARRARRLLPALGLMLLGVALFAATIATAREVETMRGDVWATIGYVANWRAITSGQDYWALFRSPSPLEHTWSLAIEEQFYVLWPLVVVGLARFNGSTLARRVIKLSLVGAAGSWVIMQLTYDVSNTARAYYGTDARAGSLLIGAAIGAAATLAVGPASALARRVIGTAGWVGAVTLTIAWTQLPGDDQFLYRVGFLGSAVSAGALIVTSVYMPNHPLTVALSWRPLRALGLISYGVYLWHWPVDVAMTPDRVGLTGWPLIGVQSVITLAIATASYRWVEQPIRRGWGSGRTWRRATPALAGALVAVTLISTAGMAVDEGPRPANVAAGVPTRGQLALQNLRLSETVGSATPRILLGGDSVAFALGQEAPANADSRFAVASAAMIGCGLTRGTPLGPKFSSPTRICREWPTVWNRAVAVFRPRAIVLLTGTWDVWPRQIDGHTVRMYSRELRNAIHQSLAVSARIAARARVPFVILTMPCLHPTPEAQERIGEGIDEPRRVRWLNRVFRSFARSTADTHLIDLHAWSCNQAPSTLIDGIHFSPQGALAAWRWITPQIDQVLAPSS